MTVFVDECRWPFRGRLWCHLVSDDSFEELHGFARTIGRPRVAFQGDHYDLDETARSLAISAGAIAIVGRDLVRRLNASGLRRGPGTSNRGLAGVVHLSAPELDTERLRLRQWRESDRETFQAMCADPERMQFRGGALDPVDTDRVLDDGAVGLAIRGVGKWAVEFRADGRFIGTVGLAFTLFDAPFTPAIALDCQMLGRAEQHAFAHEAAAAAVRYAFDALELAELVAYAAEADHATRELMEQLDTVHRGFDDFEHPERSMGDPHRRQVLYRLPAPDRRRP